MLRLRPFKTCDADTIVSWVGDETAFRKWCADRYEDYPITGEDMAAHYRQFEDCDTFFPMTAFDESGVVGHLILRYTDEEKATVRLGFVIVDDRLRGRGLGKEMLGLAVRYAREFLGARRVTLGVFENNPAAMRCYLAAGFRETASDEEEYFSVMGEKWRCIEMEL